MLENLEPKSVFHFFEEIAAIPRPSHQEKAISDYLVKFAENRGLEHYRDKANNVIIIKEATEGYENAAPVILQGHMDMVCEKVQGSDKDMEKEGIDLKIDGDWLCADGTTLGGDDGAAVAMALAILDSKELKHPRVEFLCTTGEEVGMVGANALKDEDLSMLKGRLMINIDSEEEGVCTAGCAGAGSLIADLPLERGECTMERRQIHVHGLEGGHSGAEIHKGRANGHLLAVRALIALSNAGCTRLIAMNGGKMDNVINKESVAAVALGDVAQAKEIVARVEEEARNEFALADPDIHIDLEEIPENAEYADWEPLTKECSQQAITLLASLPNGVLRMSDAIPGLVETSLSLGIVSTTEDNLHLDSFVRSNVESQLNDVLTRLIWVCEHNGAKAYVYGQYPAWEFVRESSFRDKMQEIWKDMFGKEMEVVSIHAGVECGLLATLLPGLDAVSIGPDLPGVHSVKEKLSIKSTQRIYEFVCRVLEEAK